MASVVANDELACCVRATGVPKTARRASAKTAFGRLADAISAARRRSREREVAEFVSHSGGRLTDSVERELMQRHLRSGSQGWY